MRMKANETQQYDAQQTADVGIAEINRLAATVLGTGTHKLKFCARQGDGRGVGPPGQNFPGTSGRKNQKKKKIEFFFILLMSKKNNVTDQCFASGST